MWAAEEVVYPRVGDLTLVLVRVGGLGTHSLAFDTLNRGLNSEDGTVWTTFTAMH